ncbi:hypothetical protein HUS23_08540 [Ectothiorhodospiraceae bacterium 2226]|nr:hypothetical protein HUS23_08540 [Ectothiorhodospiraceae bacterium 2226]
MNLGEELAFRYSVREPIHGLRHYPNKVVSGSYLAVAVVGGGVATGSLREAQARLEATGGALASTDDTLLAGLTREDLLGDMFYAGLRELSSALEHAVPEQMFVTPENPGEAVSAVKALQKAAAQGQRIYHVTPANQDTALADLGHSAQTLNDIRSALAMGREVIVHTDPIEVSGWHGSGYVIFDPQVGDGAWRIEGGASGSWIYALIGAFFSAVLDGLLAKYRSPTSMFGPRDEITFSRVVNFAAKALTVLGFAYATFSTVASDELGTDQKVITILANLGAAIGIMKATSWIMASALVFPVSVLVAAVVAVAIAAITLAILTVLVASKGNRDRYAFG